MNWMDKLDGLTEKATYVVAAIGVVYFGGHVVLALIG